MRDTLSLDSICLDHAPAVQKLASHPKIAETTNLPQPYPPNGAASWILSSMPRRVAGVEYSFAIIRDRDQTLVGVTSLMNVGQGEAELGYWIGHPFWGNGYATEANRQIIQFGFDTVDLDRIYARPLLRNHASCRVLDKIGFDLVDVFDNMFPKWEDSDSLCMYELKDSVRHPIPGTVGVPARSRVPSPKRRSVRLHG